MTPRLVSVMLRILVVLLTTLLAVALAERATGILQKRYFARVTLQVQRAFSEDAATSLESVTAQITSPAILRPVLNAFGRDASDEAVRDLQSLLRVQQIRHTELVQIGVTGTNPVEAAELANAIGEEYQRQGIAEQQAALASSLEGLREQLSAQRKTVEALRAEGQQLRATFGIIDISPDSEDNILPLSEALPKLAAQWAEAKELQDKIAALSDGELLAEIVEGTSFGNVLNPTMSELGRRLKQATVEEEKLTAAGGAADRLQAIRDRKSRLQKELSALIPILRGRIATELKILEIKRQLVDQMATEPPPAEEALEKYQQAKARYVEEKKHQEELERKLGARTMEGTMPRSPAIIWEKAEPPVRAEMPTALLALPLLLGLATGTGLAFLPRPGVTVLALLALLLAVFVSFRLSGGTG